MALLSVVNLFAATQDIGVDGLAVDILDDNERGVGNSVQVAAYKIGMLGGGYGLTLVLRDIGGTKGATPSEIASQVMGILVDETVRTVGKKSAERYLEKGADRVLKKLFGD